MRKGAFRLKQKRNLGSHKTCHHRNHWQERRALNEKSQLAAKQIVKTCSQNLGQISYQLTLTRLCALQILQTVFTILQLRPNFHLSSASSPKHSTGLLRLTSIFHVCATTSCCSCIRPLVSQVCVCVLLAVESVLCVRDG